MPPKKKSKPLAPSLSPAIAAKSKHTPGAQKITKLGNRAVRFTVNEILAVDDLSDTEVIRTAAGAILLCREASDRQKYTSFKSVAAVMKFIKDDGLEEESNQNLFTQLGGSIEKDVPEI